ncbi:MAG: hypothetical protein J2P25_04140 [Nocardiopsaceae bacterium]|nr:hypothetical protein [Nocardiopsaceae bacterium]
MPAAPADSAATPVPAPDGVSASADSSASLEVITSPGPGTQQHASGTPDPKTGGGRRGRRAARRPRLAMSAIFADLLDMADIPRSSYAIDEEVIGAMCLFKIEGGYEVFSCAEDSRHEVRFFEEEEAAYFYMFGVLAADALRNGRLVPEG